MTVGPVFLRGETVTLRPVEREDLEFFRAQKNDRRVWQPLGWPRPENSTQLETFFEETICDDDGVHLLIAVDGEPVGHVSFQTLDSHSAELGYWIAPAKQGNGYGADAVETLVEYGFEQRGLHRVEAGVFESNDASQGLLESVGFSRELRQREAVFVDGEYQDLLRYDVLAEE
ncbi:GNAT family N-acetyltransferase [Halovenus halobia]|uniref:GNAT family N-acetyltransferase n=1 Tax=Halovenus halobia TaxID=3396622 RepID=UPI003F5742B4